MAVGTGNIQLSQVQTEIANGSTNTSANVDDLKACFSRSIPGGFNRTYLALSNSNNPQSSAVGFDLADFKGYTQATPYIYFGSSTWTYASDNSYADIAVYFNCDLDISVAVNPTYNASYVSITAYAFPFFHSSNSYRAHPITGLNEAVRTFRVTFSTSNISVSTYVSPAFSTDYTYQNSTVSTTTDTTANYIVGGGGPSGLGPGGFDP